jgi:hypothetical protein
MVGPIWIAFTCASVNSTPHLDLISDAIPPEEDIIIVMKNGNEEK